MHNGKNIPHEDGEGGEKGEQRRRMQGQSGFLPLRGLRGWPTRSSGRKVPGIWEARLADTSDCGSGSWQVVASPSSPRSARYVSPCVGQTGQANPSLGAAFSPTRSPAQVES